jgi:hypothetical protein
MRFFDQDMLQCIESGASSFAERDSAFGERALETQPSAQGKGAAANFGLLSRKRNPATLESVSPGVSLRRQTTDDLRRWPPRLSFQ